MVNQRNGSESNLSAYMAVLLAYAIWGFFPVYLKVVAHINTAEVVAARIIWSIPCAFLALAFTKRWGSFLALFRQPRSLLLLVGTALLISTNWTLYIWAVSHNHMLDAALGYYILPLIAVVLGLVFFKEKLITWQWVGVAFAVLAVAIMTAHRGSVPILALLLALTFVFYTFFRKAISVDPIEAFTVETLVLLVPALFIMFFYMSHGIDHFWHGSTADMWLLLLGGPFTALPLMLFAWGGKQLSLVSVGLTQYLAPSAIFILAVLFFNEPLDYVQLMAFLVLWAGLVVYMIGTIKVEYRAPSSSCASKIDREKGAECL